MGLIETRSRFDFETTVTAHGWYQLAPFSFCGEKSVLEFSYLADGGAVSVEVTATDGGLKSKVQGTRNNQSNVIKRVLRLDEDFEAWFEIAEKMGFESVVDSGWGRLLRSPTVFEDIVKTVCTTNCSWAFTKSMVGSLVEKLGHVSPSGQKTFPSAETMASKDEQFYRDEIRAGYRSPFLVKLARLAAEGDIDPESFVDADTKTKQLKKELLSLPGVGNYAAENLLKLLGRYDGLALDSFLRGAFYRFNNNGKKCADKEIEAHYEGFQEWKGLAIWFDLTEKRRLELENKPSDTS